MSMNAKGFNAVDDFFHAYRGGRVALTLLLLVALLPIQGALAKDPARPMEGYCKTEFAFSPTIPGLVDLVGTCNLRHLGLTSVVATEIVIPQPDGTLSITTSGKYTAANGDELFSSFVGVGTFASPFEVNFSGTETFIGGTGRFASASGSVANNGGAQFTSPAAGVGWFNFEGRISY
jgi:hypothetical protein